MLLPGSWRLPVLYRTELEYISMLFVYLYLSSNSTSTKLVVYLYFSELSSNTASTKLEVYLYFILLSSNSTSTKLGVYMYFIVLSSNTFLCCWYTYTWPRIPLPRSWWYTCTLSFWARIHFYVVGIPILDLEFRFHEVGGIPVLQQAELEFHFHEVSGIPVLYPTELEYTFMLLVYLYLTSNSTSTKLVVYLYFSGLISNAASTKLANALWLWVIMLNNQLSKNRFCLSFIIHFEVLRWEPRSENAKIQNAKIEYIFVEK